MRSIICLPTLAVTLLGSSFASAYNAHPKLVLIIVIDQFRGDYLERYHDQFGEGGFRLLIEHGANFSDCYYNYANTRTAPGHATLFTGAYSNGHGIISNEWWDPQKKKMVSSVEDDAVKLTGITTTGPGASPHNLLADTLGDELKLATQGKARVFAIALKDRAAILPAGFAGDGAFWIDQKTGAWISSTYYRDDLPKWAQEFNSSKVAEKYLNREWKDDSGVVMGTTTPPAGKELKFYDLVGATPFANDYEFEFARQLIQQEKLGAGPATDLLAISLSANDILGHRVGPDSPQIKAMALAMDRQLAEFFQFIGKEIGLANVWIALSADHGVAPLPQVAEKLRLPAAGYSSDKLRGQLNATLSAQLTPGHTAEFVKNFDYPLAWLNQDAFTTAHIKEEDAEHAVGEAMEKLGFRGYFTRAQLAEGRVPNDAQGLEYLHSYSPEGGWYVIGVPAPFTIGVVNGTDHASPYVYDRHVPLAIYGIPFHAGTYRNRVEPVDLAVTLASLLGINAPSNAVGRVLTEALAPARHPQDSSPSRGAFQAQPQPGAYAVEAGGTAKTEAP